MTDPARLPKMSYPQHVRAILAMGLPLVGGHLAQFLIGLTDAVMVGWYGAAQLAALTLAHTVFFTFFLLGTGFAWAVMPMVARFDAEGDEQGVRRATRMGLWLSIAFFVAVLPVLMASAPLLRALGQTPQMAGMAGTYLTVAAWGMLPALGVMVLKSYLAALDETRVVFWITAIAAVLNVPFNWLLIFGNWGFPEMGIAGAALASVLTHAVSLAGAVIYARRKRPAHALFQRFWKPDWEMFARVFRLGWPIGLTNLSEVGLFAASSVFMGWLGTVALAAHGIALQVATAAFMVHLGLSNVATVRAGNALGRRDVQRLARGARTVLALSLAVSTVTVAVLVSFPEPLIGLFLAPDDPDRAAIVAVGRGLLIMAALFQFVDGAQVIALGLLRGLEDTRVPMFLAGVAYWLLGLPAALLAGFWLGWGGPGVWSGLTVGLAVAAVLLLGRFWRAGLPHVARTLRDAPPLAEPGPAP